MIRLLLLMLPLVTLAAPLDGEKLSKVKRRGGEVKPLDMTVAMAEARLNQGRYRMAAEQARACLAEKPDSGRCQIILGRSLALAGDCEEGLEVLAGLRDRRAWSSSGALAEAICHIRAGNPSAATVALEEAVWLDPKDPEARYAYAMHLVREGYVDEALEQIEAIEEVGADAGHLPLLARAWFALETDLIDPDGAIEELRRAWTLAPANGAGTQLHLLDGLRWLDLGDPFMAGPTIVEGLKLSLGHVRTIAWRAEAVRRQGYPVEAMLALTRPWVEESPNPISEAVRVRVLVDLGQLDEATQVAASLADPTSRDAIASRWYLARALGDAEGARRARDLWDRASISPIRSLEQLIPLPEQAALPLEGP